MSCRMNPEAVIAALAASLDASLKEAGVSAVDRVVTRSLKPFVQWSATDRKAGVLTLVSTGIRYEDGDGRDTDAVLGVTAIFEIRMPEKTLGVEIEQQEFALLDELRQAIEIAGCPCFDLVAVRQSAQLERPEAWIQADLEHRETEL